MRSEFRTNIPIYRPIIDNFMLQFFQLSTRSDYLFNPASGSRYSKDDHIAQIIQLMDEIPKFIAFQLRVFQPQRYVEQLTPFSRCD